MSQNVGAVVSEEPFKIADPVTKSDVTILPLTDGLYIGGTGDVVVRMMNGNLATFSAVPVGATLRIACTQVMNATTATLILALYFGKN